MAEQRISWFNERNIEKSLNLNPKYQRKPVWSVRTKQYLIDTIIRELPIPEIFMQVKTSPEGKSEYIITDGQQRIRAILEFINGEFEINEEDNSDYGGDYFIDLPTPVQQNFWAYKISVRELMSNQDDEIRAIFQRMNKNVYPLTKQELRNATYIGHFITLMNQLADEQEFFSANGIFTANDIRRMKDAEFISELFISMMHGLQNKQDTLDNYYRIYDDSWTNKEDRKKDYNKIINLIDEMMGLLKGTRWKTKSDFQSLFFVLYELSKGYIFPTENYEKIKEELNKFSDEVTSNGENNYNNLVKDYYRTIVAHTNDKTQREKRNEILRKLIIPYLIPKDKRRNFTEEERMIIWAKSDDKKCKLCGKIISYSEYSADHITPHNKGGLTIISNGQVACIPCNSAKSDK